ncbi:arginine--tRNA ligase [Nibrella saemangeumensis]|uniref:Arginine--tRNA ligase n=1 Tax=Nibrella saemangeumensis TaxID=1084526 RepID=A0ABP8MXK2_9BACT
MDIQAQLKQDIQQAIAGLFRVEQPEEVALQPTKKEFEGLYTFVTFPLTKALRKSPVEIGQAIGAYLQEQSPVVSRFNVVQGFLNISIADSVWLNVLNTMLGDASFGTLPAKEQSVMVEFSSPNTNKPLHLGHLRNNFLGASVAEILKANGYDVVKTCLVNDRGIHICKSMLAYQHFGNGETPESAGLKGDHFIGKYYVMFDKAYKQQIEELVAGGMAKEEAEKKAPLILEAQALLRKWEQSDVETVALWRQMNEWVYAGFNATYRTIGVSFDKTYYESNTYLLGKDVIEEGLQKGVFYRKDDGSVWIDLTEEGLDQKLVLRSDGTSVYMTQDLGTTDLKFQDFHNDRYIWVVGNEQDYHFAVLFAILRRLGRSYADGLYHLSYGMVDLPSGKMKSREGTVVDADDLIQEMYDTAETRTRDLGKIEDFESEEARTLYHMLAMGALKYFLLKVDPKKRMLFNPQESVDFQGHTGPFIQYTHARICSVLRKAEQQGIHPAGSLPAVDLHPTEQQLIYLLSQYPQRLAEAGADYAPSYLAQYAYELAKTYNQFYADVSILSEPDAQKTVTRVALSKVVAETIQKAMGLLCIDVPTKM